MMFAAKVSQSGCLDLMWLRQQRSPLLRKNLNNEESQSEVQDSLPFRIATGTMILPQIDQHSGLKQSPKTMSMAFDYSGVFFDVKGQCISRYQ
jgi:hypothetical protein